MNSWAILTMAAAAFVIGCSSAGPAASGGGVGADGLGGVDGAIAQDSAGGSDVGGGDVGGSDVGGVDVGGVDVGGVDVGGVDVGGVETTSGDDASGQDQTAADTGTNPDSSTTFTPASHPALPQVLSSGGPVLTTPHVVALTYDSDVLSKDVNKLLSQLTTAAYWGQTTAEYGVGPLSVDTPRSLGATAPKSIEETALLKLIDQNFSDPTSGWGPASADTVYLVVIPAGTQFYYNSGGSKVSCCGDYDGYHDQTTLAGVTAAYAITCACPGEVDGVATVDQLASTITHELIEAATDPFVQDNPAYESPGDPDAAWSNITEGEVADMCEDNADTLVNAPGVDYLVCRSWSNKNAKASQEPCVPAPDSAPYFAAAPVLTDTISVIDYWGDTVQTQGTKIAVGASKTIEVALFSSGPTSGPWQVTAYDYNDFMQGGASHLAFSWDKDQGNNGDILHLTITVKSKDASWHGEMFLIESTLGNRTSLWMGMVGQ